MSERDVRPRVNGVGMVLVVLCLAAGPMSAQSRSGPPSGRRLQEALQALQAQGLPIVFSSELVTPEMRVAAEPRAKTARQQLDELLRPFGLVAKGGPNRILLVVRAKPTRSRTPPKTSVEPLREILAAPANDIFEQSFTERVTVTAPGSHSPGEGVGRGSELGANELGALTSRLVDDPLRIVHAMPKVAAADDLRSEFSVRASPYRHVGVIIDGVAAPWLRHTAPGRGDIGTIAMLTSDVVERATLQVGAYPRLHANWLGAQLNVSLREGSRTARRFRAGVGGMSGSFIGEGPIGGEQRGSWLVALRKSHVEWPVGGDDHARTVFGFADAQSKVVYDVSPRQQVRLSMIAGRSNVERDDVNPYEFANGTNDAMMVSAGWRSQFGSRLIVDQQTSLVDHSFQDRSSGQEPVAGGANRAFTYRVDVTHALLDGIIETGGAVQRVTGSKSGYGPAGRELGANSSRPTERLDDLADSWWVRSGHLQFRWTVAPQLVIGPGVRLADSTLIGRHALDRWLNAEWLFRPAWSVHASAGVVHQFPELEQLRGSTFAPALRPERAAHADVGIGQRLTSTVRWDATAYFRRERDILREPEIHPRIVDGVLADWVGYGRYENAVTGLSRGIELLLERRSESGLSGWIGYSYGTATQTDVPRHEVYRADFDRRHGVNAAGWYRFPHGTLVTATFLGGTSLPIPGYLAVGDGGLIAGSRRNKVQLPGYARLDLRAEHTLALNARRFTPYVEVLNALNRRHFGVGGGYIRRGTGEAVGFTERLLPRLATAGLRVEF